MAPKLYGWQHITYLLISFLLMAVFIFLIKKYVKKDKTLTLIIKIIALSLFITIFLNRIAQVISYNNWLYLIPNTFCGLSSMALSLAVLFLKKDSGVLHYLVYIGFLGGVLTMLYPDFIGQAPSIFYFPTITGLLHHTIMVFLILIMVFTKYFQPSIKRWYAIPIGWCCYMTFGLFLYDVLGIHAMEIGETFENVKGTNWAYAGLAFFGLYLIFMETYELIIKRKKEKTILSNKPIHT